MADIVYFLIIIFQYYSEDAKFLKEFETQFQIHENPKLPFCTPQSIPSKLIINGRAIRIKVNHFSGLQFNAEISSSCNCSFKDASSNSYSYNGTGKPLLVYKFTGSVNTTDSRPACLADTFEKTTIRGRFANISHNTPKLMGTFNNDSKILEDKQFSSLFEDDIYSVMKQDSLSQRLNKNGSFLLAYKCIFPPLEIINWTELYIKLGVFIGIVCCLGTVFLFKIILKKS